MEEDHSVDDESSTDPPLAKCLHLPLYGLNYSVVWGYNGTLYLCPILPDRPGIPSSNHPAWLIPCLSNNRRERDKWQHLYGHHHFRH